MKNTLAMFVVVFALVCVTGCSRKAVKEEPAPDYAVSQVKAPAAPVVVEVPVDPKVRAAQQKYEDGLRKFDRANYQGALKDWEDCLKIDPRNEDCVRGVRGAQDMINSLAAKRK